MGDFTINDKEEFQQAIFYAAQKIGYQTLADKFKVSPGTIQRWIDTGGQHLAEYTRKVIKKRALAFLQKANEKTEKEEFKSFVAEALKKLTAEEIVQLCGDEVATTTVLRWASGGASPHPILRQLFTQLIRKKLLQNKKAD